MTNREKINSMTNDEFAEFLDESCCKYCIYSGMPCKDLSCSLGIRIFLDSEIEDEVK